MNAKERRHLEELYAYAIALEHRAAPGQLEFHEGFTWGINRALKAVGYSWSARFDI